MNDLILYSTSACHLCESAVRLLGSMPELRRRPWRVVDIADDEALLERYGKRIPVLACCERERDWPFNADDVVDLMACARFPPSEARPVRPAS